MISISAVSWPVPIAGGPERSHYWPCIDNSFKNQSRKKKCDYLQEHMSDPICNEKWYYLLEKSPLDIEPESATIGFQTWK